MSTEATRLKTLVADIPLGQHMIARALNEKFEILPTDTLAEAKMLLLGSLGIAGHRFDLVVCGMHFDDCRMLELLHFVIEMPELSKLPFLVIQSKKSEISFASAVVLADMLGACDILDLQNLSADDANLKVQSTINRVLALKS